MICDANRVLTMAVTLPEGLPLEDVSAYDPSHLHGVALTLGLAAIIAGRIPARRALRVVALVALRDE
jgi:ABC-type lipoprotein release transport system permease subunit